MFGDLALVEGGESLAAGHECGDMPQTGEGRVLREDRQVTRASANPPGRSCWPTALQPPRTECFVLVLTGQAVGKWHGDFL